MNKNDKALLYIESELQKKAIGLNVKIETEETKKNHKLLLEDFEVLIYIKEILENENQKEV